MWLRAVLLDKYKIKNVFIKSDNIIFYVLGPPNARICDSKDRGCVKKVQKLVENTENNCDCFESCSFVKYDVKVYQERCSCSEMAIGFGNDFFLSLIKSHVFGTSELLASIGGFLSLIGGVSVISLLELIYYIGCRNLMRKRRKNEVEPEENVVKKESICVILMKFCNLSSIHGMNYASGENLFGL